jgi:hypothetical protein
MKQQVGIFLTEKEENNEEAVEVFFHSGERIPGFMGLRRGGRQQQWHRPDH